MNKCFIKVYEGVSEAPIFYRKMFEKANKPTPKDFNLIERTSEETFLGDIPVNYYTYTSSQNETIYLADIRLAGEIGDIIASNNKIPKDRIERQINVFLYKAKKDLKI